jgi:hypothetical protein
MNEPFDALACFGPIIERKVVVPACYGGSRPSSNSGRLVPRRNFLSDPHHSPFRYVLDALTVCGDRVAPHRDLRPIQIRI